jgi:tetratricopeptide (TPR) repeat protein
MKRFVIVLSLIAVMARDSLAQTPSTDSLDVRVLRAIAAYHSGRRDEAKREFSRLVDLYNARGGRLNSGDHIMVAMALTYLGKEEPQVYKDALIVYDRAIEADPTNLTARVKLAELFLDKYQSGEAKNTLAEVFKRDANYVPALVLEARRRDFDNEPGADSVLSRALEKEPENVPGRVLRARFLADVEDFAGARREIDRALRAAPNDAAALSAGLALAVAVGDSATQTTLTRRYRELYPREAGAFVAVAEQISRVRQYGDAATWAREAVKIDSTNWQAHTVLGLNLLRLGEIAEGRKSLEKAFAGDPYNIWVKNTLDLLDTFGEYDEITRGPFRFMIEKAESPIISLYLGELADRAFETFSKRYGFTPTKPIRIEVYRSHADFSVRTVGLAGLGALGVSFGNAVAFDSPAAKDIGMFNWASTAWHELAHTFTLGATNHAIPRWLSEGLSVYEERRARKGWGQNVSPAFLQAYLDGKLVPPSRLNDGFVRPAFPQQVIFSYYQASLVCELIARDFGERALLEMLQAYREGLNTDQVFRRVLKTDLAAFDKRFDAYLKLRFGGALNVLRDRSYLREVAAGRALLRSGDTTAAIAPLERARSLFPDYGGGDGAYPLLVRALMAKGDRKQASEVLSRMVALGDVPYETHMTLADLLLQQGDSAGAATALESAIFMNPYEIEHHERLAALYSRLGDKQKTIRERRAVVALNPVDRAEAYYQLAIAYRDAGATGDARRSIVRALEDAPHFERGQELLIQLHEARKP